jgi:hypothetical protein
MVLLHQSMSRRLYCVRFGDSSYTGAEKEDRDSIDIDTHVEETRFSRLRLVCTSSCNVSVGSRVGGPPTSMEFIHHHWLVLRSLRHDLRVLSLGKSQGGQCHDTTQNIPEEGGVPWLFDIVHAIRCKSLQFFQTPISVARG